MSRCVTLLNDKVASLHLRINDLDPYNSKQNLEINGIRKYPNENCKELVVGVVKHSNQK